MLKFIKNHMATVDGIEIFPIISLIIFVVFFIYLVRYVYKTDKSLIEEVSQYPIDNNTENLKK